jgi:porphobilinogen synthase
MSRKTNPSSGGPLPAPSFPTTRLRRNRKADWSRRLVAETTLTPADLVWPLFVIEGSNERQPISSLPGVERLSSDLIVDAARQAEELGIPAIALFPNTDPERLSDDGREATNDDNLVCRATRAVKDAGLNIGLILDVALDPYTSHGHDGIVRNGKVDNDATLEMLAKQAVVQARAGADIVAPSDMMDGRVGAIRQALDANGHHDTQILSYAAKYASGFYGPFREAVGSGDRLTGDKRGYQMDHANSDEALREVALDIAEGADMVMVKPGLAYLDIVHRVSSAFDVPTLAYHVSAEYAMVEAAAANHWIDGERVMMESLMAFKRAGAAAIFTYYAPKAAKLLNVQSP